jgi:alpha-L-fucosidase
MKSLKFYILFLLLTGMKANGQYKEQIYFPDPDPLIRQRLEQWQDIKFGLLMHWGPSMGIMYHTRRRLVLQL